MMNKELKFNADARASVLKGMEVLANAVGSTLGPKGRCVVIDEWADGKPLVTKDGVTVARSIQLKDKFENLGVQLLRQASLASLAMSGDGTTTACVLAYNMIKYAETLIDSGENPIKIKNELVPLIEEILENLKKQAIPVTEDDLEKIATISANNDKAIGKLLADTFKRIGMDGVVTVEESPSTKTYTDIIDGMQFERGYETPYFATDPIKGNCILENCYVLITDQKVQLMNDLIPILEVVRKKSRPILIIAQDYDDEVIQNLKLNKLRNVIQVCAVKAPSYGEYRKDILQDLAYLTGGTVISYESGIELQNVKEEMLGQCGKIIVNNETTTIIHGNGNQKLIDARVMQIKQQLENLSDTMDRDFLKDFYAQRIAKLTGGIACIYVGGTTELEMRERKDRMEDAVCAVKAAIEEGVVVGGGLSFIKAALNSKLWDIPGGPSDAELIIFKGLDSVLGTILDNCGSVNAEPIDAENNIGYDANTDTYVNLLDAGIINPVKSDRLAFENAVSVLNTYLSISCLVVNEDIQY